MGISFTGGLRLARSRAIRAARAAGKGQLAIAGGLRVGVGTVRKVMGADAPS
jgi:hypothetical protein